MLSRAKLVNRGMTPSLWGLALATLGLVVAIGAVLVRLQGEQNRMEERFDTDRLFAGVALERSTDQLSVAFDLYLASPTPARVDLIALSLDALARRRATLPTDEWTAETGSEPTEPLRPSRETAAVLATLDHLAVDAREAISGSGLPQPARIDALQAELAGVRERLHRLVLSALEEKDARRAAERQRSQESYRTLLFLLSGALVCGALLVLLFLFKQRALTRTQAALSHALDERTRQAVQSRNRLTAIFDHAPVEIFLKDREGRYVQVNRRLEEHFQLNAEDLIGKLPREVIAPEIAELAEEHDREVLERGEAVVRENMTTVRGNERWLYSIKFPIFDSDGAIEGIGAVVADLSDAKRAEARGRAIGQRFQALLGNAPFAIYLKDTERRYQIVNHHFTVNYGADVNTIVGRTAEEVFGEDVPASMHDSDREVLCEGRTVELDVTSAKHSSPREYQVVKFPITDESGNVVGLGGVDIDITERVRAERALKAAKEEAETANRAKSDFLANMSHEIRTPLNAILGFADLIREEMFGPLGSARYRDYAEDIHRSGAHLLEIIDEILDLSKIEAGRYDVRFEPVALAEIAETCRTLIEGAAKDKRITLALAVAEGLTAQTDERAVKQILLNLMSNAVKFTPQGGRIDIIGRERTDGTYELVVRDTGVGIPAEDLSRVMEPFTQSGNPTVSTEAGSGTGIGLAICSKLAELIAGELRLESTLGEGTTATLSLPGAEADTIPPNRGSETV